MRTLATVFRAMPEDADNLDLDTAAEVVTVRLDFPDGDGPGGYTSAVVTHGFDADGSWSSEFLTRVLGDDGAVSGFVHARARILPGAAQFTPFPDNEAAWTWTTAAPVGFALTAVLLHEAYSAAVSAELSASAEGDSFRPTLHAPEDMNLRDLAALLELGDAGVATRVHTLDL